MATHLMDGPAGIVSITVLVAVAITEIVLESAFAT
jgi:hypothetical protein